METPVLSQSEKSKSLSGNKSKKKKKEKIHTVLYGSDTFKSYRLIQSSAQILDQKFRDVFNFVAPIKPKWSEINKIPKEERAQFRKSLNQPTNPSRKYIVFGMNSVMRAIEKGLCLVVLVSTDVRPPLILRHISDCCVTEKIPFIQVPMLRYILIKNFGFPGAIFAFREMPEDDPLHSVLNYLVECFPEMCNEIKLLKQKSLESQKVIENNTEFLKKSTKLNSVKSSNYVESNKVQSKIKLGTILYRSDVQTRCFVPPMKEDLKNSFNFDFIAFDKEESEEETIISKEEQQKFVKQIYKNLSVKRLQPNPKRKKGNKNKRKKTVITANIQS